MEKIFITGNLGNDATIDTYGQDTVIRFRVACNRRYMNRAGEQTNETTWYSCSYWNVRPELAGILLSGRRIMVEGTPSTRAYQNKQDMQWYVSNDVRVIYHEMQDGHPSNRQGAPLNVPQNAVVHQATTVAPSEYHMTQQQQTAGVTAPATIQMPNRVTEATPAPVQAQPPLFPNIAPQLPETPLNGTASSTPETKGIAMEEVKVIVTDLPY